MVILHHSRGPTWVSEWKSLRCLFSFRMSISFSNLIVDVSQWFRFLVFKLIILILRAVFIYSFRSFDESLVDTLLLFNNPKVFVGFFIAKMIRNRTFHLLWFVNVRWLFGANKSIYSYIRPFILLLLCVCVCVCYIALRIYIHIYVRLTSIEIRITCAKKLWIVRSEAAQSI